MASRVKKTVQPSATLLADIYQTMGRVEGQNELIIAEQGRAAEGRKELYEAVERGRSDTALVAQDVALLVQDFGTEKMRVDKIEPAVKTMQGFRLQVSVAVVFVTAVVTGAFNIVWLGIAHFNEIKVAFREMLR